MNSLNNLKNSNRGRRAVKRLGRGPGSGKGKTCARGQKGAGARSGYKTRWGYEGGQMRLHLKLPQRGFSNVKFQNRLETINLGLVEKVFSKGETVNEESLRQKGIIKGPINGIKLLGGGELTKKVTIEVDAISASAREKLEKAKITINEKS
jgi:large subunit ribosomal protein L15